MAEPPVFIHHATDLQTFYQPYLEGFLVRHESIVLAPYMWDFLDYMQPCRDRIYVAVSATPTARDAVVDGRVVGRRAQVWQLWGDEVVKLGFGIAVAKRYRRRARYRWPQARIINYEDTICEYTAREQGP